MFNAEICEGNKMVNKGKLEEIIYLDSQRAFAEVLHRRQETVKESCQPLGKR